jgi:hypothetical protein
LESFALEPRGGFTGSWIGSRWLGHAPKNKNYSASENLNQVRYLSSLGQGCGTIDGGMLASEGHMISNDLGLEGHRNIRIVIQPHERWH